MKMTTYNHQTTPHISCMISGWPVSRQDISTPFNTLIKFEATEYFIRYSIHVWNFKNIRFDVRFEWNSRFVPFLLVWSYCAIQKMTTVHCRQVLVYLEFVHNQLMFVMLLAFTLDYTYRCPRSLNCTDCVVPATRSDFDVTLFLFLFQLFMSCLINLQNEQILNEVCCNSS